MTPAPARGEFLVRLRHLLGDEDAATMPEYAFVLAFIAALSISIVTTLGTTVQEFFANIDAGI